MKLSIRIFLLLCFTGAGSYATAQTKPDSTTSMSDYYIDFSVPDIGAFTLLNTKPTMIANPGNTKEFSASLVNIFGGLNVITPGLAIDWSPYRTFRDSSFIKTPGTYRNDFFLRNIQLTFGTVGDTAGSRVATGVKWTIWDKSDPLNDSAFGANLINANSGRLRSNATHRSELLVEKDKYFDRVRASRKAPDLYFAIKKKVDTLFNVSRADSLFYKQEIYVIYARVRDSIDVVLKAYNASNDSAQQVAMLSLAELNELEALCYSFKRAALEDVDLQLQIVRSVRKMKKAWMKEHWNSSVVTVGFGWMGNSPDNKWASLGTHSYRGYINGKCKLGPKAQLTYIGVFGAPKVTAKTDSSITSNLFGGVRFLYGNARNRFSVDLGYGYDVASSNTYSTQTLLTTIGVEFKLADGVFMELAAGFNGDPAELHNANILAVGSFKYALQRASRFDIP